MSPRLVSCYFGDEDWDRMARVLEYSARQHCAGWDVAVSRVDPPPLTHALAAGKVSNTRKLDHWADRMWCEWCASDGGQVLLIDADTMILGPLDSVWSEEFDIAYTAKDAGPFPLNAGVIFLRASDRTRAFMLRWRDENRRMLAEPAYHEPWYRRYGGLNQAALGKLLTEGAAADLGVRVAQLPCSIWNCENTTWSSFDSATRIVHLKNGLRLAALAKGAGSARLMPLVRLWRGLERQALAAGGGAA